MTANKYIRIGVLLILGIFMLGSAIPVMAAADNIPAGNGFAYRAQTMINVLSDLTGLDINTIRQERISGKSAQDIAEENGVDNTVLVEEISELNENRLQQLLDNGIITQDQYDTCINLMPERIQERLERTSTGNAFMQQGRRGGGRGMGAGFCGAQGMQGLGRGQCNNPACPLYNNGN